MQAITDYEATRALVLEERSRGLSLTDAAPPKRSCSC